MLNKKGFTIAEVLVSFTLITVILLSIIGSTVFYRDKLKAEEVKSQLIDFKNGITKIIYDDIIKDKARKVETCLGEANCVNIVNGDGSIHNLRIYEVPVTSSGEKRGSYLMYDGVKYFLPDSDLAGLDGDNTVRVCDFTNGIRFSFYNDMYTIKISFSHKDFDIHKDILLTVIGGNNEYSYTSPSVPTLALADERVGLVPNGGNKSNLYSYTGDGNVKCASSKPAIATCSVDEANQKIVVTPVSIGDNVVITVTATSTTNFYAPEPASFIVDVNKKTPTLTVTNASINATYGTNTSNSYTYDGDGTVTCSSSDTSKVTCSVDANNKKINLVPKAVTTSAVTITVSASETAEYFAPTSKTFTVSVAKAVATCPTTSNYSGTYDTNPHKISVTAAASGGTTYYRIDGGSWSTTNPSRTNAGTSTVDVKVVGDSNHNDNTSCASKTITISKATTYLILSPMSGKVIKGSSTTATFSSNNPDGTVSCTTSNSSIATCSVSENTVTINGTGRGSATITVQQSQGTNYKQSSGRPYSITVDALDVGTYFSLTPTLTSYTIPGSVTGYSSSQTINPSELNLWRVIAINSNGTIDAVSEYASSSKVYFAGKTGYANFVGGLQTISTSYAKSGYTVATRIMGYDGQTLTISDTSLLETTMDDIENFYGNGSSTANPTSGTGQEYRGGLTGDTLYLKDFKLVSNAYKNESAYQGSYGYWVKAYKVGTSPETSTYGTTYWMASRRYRAETGSLNQFSGRYIDASGIIYNQHDFIWCSDTCMDMNGSGALRPIITLKSEVTISGGSGTKPGPYKLSIS